MSVRTRTQDDDIAQQPGPSRDFRGWALARRDALRSTAYLLCGDWHLSDDLVQEALTRIYSRWAAVSRDGPPDAYTRRVLVRLYLDRRRRAFWSRERTTAQVPDTAVTVDVPAVDGDRDLLLGALTTLPPQQRAAVVLRYWEDLSHDQVARLLRCSTGTVRAHTSRGLAALRAELARRGVTDSLALAVDEEASR